MRDLLLQKERRKVARNYFLIRNSEGTGIGRTSIRPGCSDRNGEVFVVAPERYVEIFLIENSDIVNYYGYDAAILFAIQSWISD